MLVMYLLSGQESANATTSTIPSSATWIDCSKVLQYSYTLWGEGRDWSFLYLEVVKRWGAAALAVSTGLPLPLHLGPLCACSTTEVTVLFTPLIFMILFFRMSLNSSISEAETRETISNSPVTS